MVKKIRFIIRGISFIALLTVLFVGFGYYFTAISKPNEAGNELRMSMAYRGELRNSVDIAFIGNSNVYRGVSPNDVTRGLGERAIVSGEGGIDIESVENRMKDLFRYQSPKLVVLDADCLFTSMNISYGKLKWKNTRVIDRNNKMLARKKEMPGIVRRAINAKKKFNNNNRAIIAGVNYLCPLFRNHDAWKNVLAGKYRFSLRDYYRFPHRGMAVCDRIRAYKGPLNYMDLPENNNMKDNVITPEQIKVLEDMIKICESHNARLVLINVPSANTWNRARHNQIQKFATEHSLEYYDYNDKVPAGFNWKKHSKDGGNHLNTHGARIVSRAFVKDMMNNGSKKISVSTTN